MANKNKLKEMLNKRNPLLDTPLVETKREAVTPVNLYTNPQVDNKEESTQVHKTTSTQTVMDTKPQVAKETKPQIVKQTTHLNPQTIKELKRYALDNDLKDYEVMQEAVVMYLKAKRKP